LDTDHYERSCFAPSGIASSGEQQWSLEGDQAQNPRRDNDEDNGATLHGTVMLSFEAWENGIISAKIVDICGTESLKVMTVGD
jgi:hypothetical protein